MAVLTIYSNAVTSSEFADASDAQGAPASGDSAPYATKAIAAAGTATLTGAFAATPIPGTITGISAILTCRSTDAASTELLFTLAGVTFPSVLGPQAAFATQADSGSGFNAATLKAAIVAGLSGLAAAFSSGAGGTVDAKGLGIIVTYTPTGGGAGSPEEVSLIWPNV
jgi:hypothetical protein